MTDAEIRLYSLRLKSAAMQSPDDVYSLVCIQLQLICNLILYI